MTTLTVTIPMRLESRKNRREHWAVRRRREKPQEHAVWANVLSAVRGQVTPVPTSVQFCRVGATLLDSDNLQLACSHLRDSVAKTFKVDDGPSGPIEWRYDQRQGPWAIEVSLTYASPRSRDSHARIQEAELLAENARLRRGKR